jgi:hypothetical protein
MQINIEFLVVAYFVTMFVDWILQWQWQAENKSRWTLGDNWRDSAFALLTHGMVYAVISVVVLMLMGILSLDQYVVAEKVMGTLFISHAIIDSRIPVKWVMKFKGMTEAQINDYPNYGFMHIGIDHRLHEAVLVGLAFFVK